MPISIVLSVLSRFNHTLLWKTVGVPDREEGADGGINASGEYEIYLDNTDNTIKHGKNVGQQGGQQADNRTTGRRVPCHAR